MDMESSFVMKDRIRQEIYRPCTPLPNATLRKTAAQSTKENMITEDRRKRISRDRTGERLAARERGACAPG